MIIALIILVVSLDLAQTNCTLIIALVMVDILETDVSMVSNKFSILI